MYKKLTKKISPKVDIIIVNWNTGGLLNECLDSISKYKSNFVSSVIIVDNNSKDRSHLCAKEYDGVKLISLKNNFGFAKACNIGAAESISDYFLFLNPDARLIKNTLKKVINFMESPNSKSNGICGVQLLNDLGQTSRSCSRFPTIYRHLFYAIGLSKLFPHLGSPMREWSHDEDRKVDQLMGAFFFIRSQLFNTLGGFDERFFVYYEEVDLSYRAKLKGYDSIFISNVQAFHLGGGSSDKVKAKRIFYSQRSHITYAFKHYSIFGCIITVFISLFIEPITRTLLSLFNGKNIVDVWRAYLMLIKWLPNFSNKKHLFS